jgi:hypothetical protein
MASHRVSVNVHLRDLVVLFASAAMMSDITCKYFCDSPVRCIEFQMKSAVLVHIIIVLLVLTNT